MRILFAFLLLATLDAQQLHKVAVIAHRGEHQTRPENTLSAFQGAIDAGADFIEIDVRTTKDGKLIIMHNATVDHTTNGSGAVKEMTFEEVRALDAGVKFSREFSGIKIPTFEEVLQLAQGKIGIYIDMKNASATDVIAALEKYNMQDHVVVYGGLRYLRDIQNLRPQIKVMPEAVSASVLLKLISDFHPRVIAFGEPDFKDEILVIAKQNDAEIYVDRLGDADNLASWQDAIDRGATGIQTNRPAELVKYLRSKGYHN